MSKSFDRIIANNIAPAYRDSGKTVSIYRGEELILDAELVSRRGSSCDLKPFDRGTYRIHTDGLILCYGQEEFEITSCEIVEVPGQHKCWRMTIEKIETPFQLHDI